MITTTSSVRELYVVEGGRAKERAKSEDKGKREKRQAAANRAKKKRHLPPPFSLGIFCEKGISKSCNYPVFLLWGTAIVCYL